MLEPKSCILQAVEGLPIAQDVALHSIIGDKGNVVGEPTDGVVPMKSARHSGVVTEHIVSAKHTEIQSKPETIELVAEILRTHVQSLGDHSVTFVSANNHRENKNAVPIQPNSETQTSKEP